MHLSRLNQVQKRLLTIIVLHKTVLEIAEMRLYLFQDPGSDHVLERLADTCQHTDRSILFTTRLEQGPNKLDFQNLLVLAVYKRPVT